MGAVALSAGVAQAASLSAEKALRRAAAHPKLKHHRQLVSLRLIGRFRAETWRWQALTGHARTRGATRPSTRAVLRFWARAAGRAYAAAIHPTHKRAWLCIHRYEGSWHDSGDPYWGGLQMDRGFMAHYAPRYLLRRGFADRWSPLEQMWVAERAFHHRGFNSWPNTARICGLI